MSSPELNTATTVWNAWSPPWGRALLVLGLCSGRQGHRHCTSFGPGHWAVMKEVRTGLGGHRLYHRHPPSKGCGVAKGPEVPEVSIS